MMRAILIFLYAAVLSSLAYGDEAPDVSMHITEGSYRVGDVIELYAEMRRPEFGEFELQLPSHPQLHFLAYTREPLRYVDGVYLQRILILLQALDSGDFELDAFTATIRQGEKVVELQLPQLSFTVESYGAEDVSADLAELSNDSQIIEQSSVFIWIVTILLALCLVLLVRRFLHKQEPKTEVLAQSEGLDALMAALKAGSPVIGLIEGLLTSESLVLSPDVRELLEEAVYANRLNKTRLLDQLEKEGVR